MALQELLRRHLAGEKQVGLPVAEAWELEALGMKKAEVLAVSRRSDH